MKINKEDLNSVYVLQSNEMSTPYVVVGKNIEENEDVKDYAIKTRLTTGAFIENGVVTSKEIIALPNLECLKSLRAEMFAVRLISTTGDKTQKMFTIGTKEYLSDALKQTTVMLEAAELIAGETMVVSYDQFRDFVYSSDLVTGAVEGEKLITLDGEQFEIDAPDTLADIPNIVQEALFNIYIEKVEAMRREETDVFMNAESVEAVDVKEIKEVK